MGGVGALRQGHVGSFQLRGGAVAGRCDRLAQLIRIGASQQALDWDRHLIRIPQPAVAVAVGQVHGLHHPMNRGGTVQARGRQIQGLQDVQQLQQGHATATGGRHGEHRIAPKAAGQGPHQLGAIASQISLANQAAPLLHQPHQGLRRCPLVEAPVTLLGQPAQGGRQQGLAQDLPGLVGLGALVRSARRLEKEAARQGVGLEQSRGLLQGVTEFLAHREPLLRQADGRCQHLGQAEAPIAALAQHQTGGGARHPRAQQAAGGPLAIDLALSVEKHAGRSRQGGLFAEVDGDGMAAAQGKLGVRSWVCGVVGGQIAGVQETAPALGGGWPRQPGHQETATAQISSLGKGDGQGKRCGHRRVHGVAAAAQDLGPHLRGNRLLAGHDPLGRPHRVKALAPFLEHIGGCWSAWRCRLGALGLGPHRNLNLNRAQGQGHQVGRQAGHTHGATGRHQAPPGAP